MFEQIRDDEPQIDHDIEFSQEVDTTSSSDEVEARVYTITEKLEIGHQILDLIDNGLGMTQVAREYDISRRALGNWLRDDGELAIRYDNIIMPKIELAIDSILTEDLSVLEVLKVCKLAPSIFWRRLREPRFEAKYHEIQACLIEKICNAIEAGTPVRQATKKQGIVFETFYQWLQKYPDLLKLYERVKIPIIETIYELIVEKDTPAQEAISQQGLNIKTFWLWLADPQFEAMRTKISYHLINKICNAIEAGTPVHKAIEQQGIVSTTFYQWLQKYPDLLKLYERVKIPIIETIYELIVEKDTPAQEAISQQGLDIKTFWQWLADPQFEAMRTSLKYLLVNRICQLIKQGFNVAEAVEAGGIGNNTYHRWQKQDSTLRKLHEDALQHKRERSRQLQKQHYQDVAVLSKDFYKS